MELSRPLIWSAPNNGVGPAANFPCWDASPTPPSYAFLCNAAHHQHFCYCPAADSYATSTAKFCNFPLANGTSEAAMLDDHVDERVQVNRAVLEKMIIGGQPDLPSAGVFFDRLAQSTGTVISWPTRLKIGAKTKKDPFVRVAGRPTDVNLAVHKMLVLLQPKVARHSIMGGAGGGQNRVTLKIDVSFTDHSHIIGRGGKNTQDIMRETGCHIHFPDANKDRDNDKSNQVSIAGSLDAIERARHRLRSYAPLQICFTLDRKRLKRDVDLTQLSENPCLERLIGMKDISAVIRRSRRCVAADADSFCLVRGSVNQQDRVRHAVIRLMRLCFHEGEQVDCSTTLEILPAQQLSVAGKNFERIQYIVNRSGAKIHHPSLGDRSKGASTFYIVGQLDRVIEARRHLAAFLPVQMTFDLREGHCADDIDYTSIENQLNVQISVKNRPESKSRTITVRSDEKNLNNVYAVRHRLLHSSTNEKPVVCRDYDFVLGCLGEPPPPPPLLVEPFSMVGMAESLAGQFPLQSPLVPIELQPATPNGISSDTETKDQSPLANSPAEGDAESTPKFPKHLELCPAKLQLDKAVGNNDPDPNSPIATALLAGHALLSSKAPGAERRLSDYDKKKLWATKVMQQDVGEGYRQPTEAWSGLGFSRTAPTVLLKNGFAPLAGNGLCLRTNLLPIDEEDGEENNRGGPGPATGRIASLRRNCGFGLTSSTFDDRVLQQWDNSLFYNNLPAILTALGLEQHLPTFEREEVDYDTFLAMNEKDLEDLGVTKKGDRIRLKIAAKQLQSAFGSSSRGLGFVGFGNTQTAKHPSSSDEQSKM